MTKPKNVKAVVSGIATADGKKSLLSRVEAHLRRHQYDRNRETEPSNVVAARATIKKWETDSEGRERDRICRLERAANEAREAIHFGSVEEAIRAVREFETLDRDGR